MPEIITAYAGPKNDVLDKNIYSDKIELKDNDVIYLPDKKLGIRYCQDYFASTAYCRQ